MRFKYISRPERSRRVDASLAFARARALASRVSRRADARDRTSRRPSSSPARITFGAMDDDARSTLASSARAHAVAHFGVGNELLVCNLDGRGASEAPRRVTWSGFSASRAALATTTSEALFVMRDREVRARCDECDGRRC